MRSLRTKSADRRRVEREKSFIQSCDPSRDVYRRPELVRRDIAALEHRSIVIHASTLQSCPLQVHSRARESVSILARQTHARQRATHELVNPFSRARSISANHML